ncbi:hypothetical protein B566_EDAN005305 [Ephemera danica]|nr:hypothetical protein B566_EDAN005305 [Ephemera danica]
MLHSIKGEGGENVHQQHTDRRGAFAGQQWIFLQTTRVTGPQRSAGAVSAREGPRNNRGHRWSIAPEESRGGTGGVYRCRGALEGRGRIVNYAESTTDG